ncbi:MAG: RNA methyltransferase [Ignavibacteriales bacterium]|nr:RNA methyltransferase [Ignavibacteriales bacterium]
MRKLDHKEISKKRYTIAELQNSERFPIYGLLDNIRSLYNVGSMFRSADGARCAKLFLTGYTPSPPRKEIDKTALGATESVPWEYFQSPLEAVNIIKEMGIKICVLEHTTHSRPYYKLDGSEFPLCIVVGNEITGISREIIENADMAIEIPMYGMKQSLNAAVAFGITIFGCVSVLKSNP